MDCRLWGRTESTLSAVWETVWGTGGQAVSQKVLEETEAAEGPRGNVGKGLRPGFGPHL